MKPYKIKILQINLNAKPMNTILLTTLNIIALISSFGIIMTNNPIHAIFFLILTVTIVTIIFLFNNIEFFALVLMIVYVGAIAVLFLFVIMFLKLKTIPYVHHIDKRLACITTITAYMLTFTMLYLTTPFNQTHTKTPASYPGTNFSINYTNNTEVLGYELFTIYAPLFILIVVILIIALIGAMLLILNPYSNKLKMQSKLTQLSQTSLKTIKLFSKNI